MRYKNFCPYGALSVMANAPRVTYGQGIARHHGSHRSLLPTPYSLLPTPYSLLPTPYSLLPTPYSLLPTP
ncbi:hypothetical protein [Moorena sp. SIOASIH]|uniref:hypothetical protein n=1 Tax=Moorena sp. SIOASIH TaxID=2607817 RepID=UPI0025CF2B34|nr:hypothetical protein [Moorena sp. SIOASIH]